ncbi:bifunctional 23S rRNA (guanine(2069)-N(7))-methyltransferase RlmK/23S rRNA (guanine(2445)-N(2))-methyltransferase RlmL [Xanthomonadaceae bacterium JHOS43]|nr:bifunctional 23S rRNA (guanine(2069)-N(7))-methyltransferase RlmK/23S rRNA (guanine(2445)-N(2))-methyltransferase RlmL [Xanthomonadaceae bacterium JHOS43]
MTFFAPCAKGIEYLLVDELRELGASEVREALAGVHFSGPLETGYRACLWSRLASRVLLRLAQFEALDEAALYAGVQAIDWSEQVSENGTLAVDANLHASHLTHARYAAQKVKDAVVDQFRERFGVRPSVEVERPDLRIVLSLRRNIAGVFVDLAGEALHRRGWRGPQVEAPLKETLACAVLLRGGWTDISARGGALVDPMCGSGTLLIEAARMSADVAPGLSRSYFGFLGWRGHDVALWNRLIAEADERSRRGRAGLTPRFFGYDISPEAIAASRENIARAGLSGVISVERRDVAMLDAPADAQAGLMVCNPPYDERLAADASLYRALGATLKRSFAGWQAAILTGDPELGRALGLRPEKRYALHNGALACELLRIERIEPPRERAFERQPLSEGAQMVANRLRKNLKALGKWREREGVSCYRVYDADLPEYAAAVDVYSGVPEEAPNSTPEVWLHVQEYQAPASIPEETTRQRLADLVRAAMDVFELPRARVAVKTRARGKGGSKYGRFDARGQFLIVRERAARLRVNLFDYLDTGLFLDHRPLRLRMAREANGLRVLNLFCYTGAVSVQAGLGGAASTTSVDLSATYLEWAAKNLALNGLAGQAHRLVQADVMEWLAAERARYDLIFCDPPTFSNSARADDFDLQRHHARLIHACMDRLTPDGVLLFSNNFRRFRLDSGLSEEFDVSDIRASTLDPDFARDPKIHAAWEIRWPWRTGS